MRREVGIGILAGCAVTVEINIVVFQYNVKYIGTIFFHGSLIGECPGAFGCYRNIETHSAVQSHLEICNLCSWTNVEILTWPHIGIGIIIVYVYCKWGCASV